MATLAAVAARRAATLARTPAPSQAASLIPRRGLAGAADHHGPPKVNFWQDPMSPSKWKEEHFVIVSLTGWGLLFFSGYKFFTKGKKEEVTMKATPADNGYPAREVGLKTGFQTGEELGFYMRVIWRCCCVK
ncbi:hypothetical protein V6N11_082974 [Hibiscus sabdariffa]|uniref:Uncharacterized protein n=1 Tax=Hibiscus sabdariffa TaxID=183260 RepID=A0ABR2QKH0_9ROSI